MKMTRRLFTAGSALSLVLWAAVMVLWVRSYWCADGAVLRPGDGRTCVFGVSTRGRVKLVFARQRGAPDRTFGPGLMVMSDVAYDMSPLPHRFLGLGWGRTTDLPPWFFRPAVAVPDAYVAGVLLVVPLAWVLRRRNGRAQRSGFQVEPVREEKG